jgi:pimeloyl-ACP methyl ester carboxylesterase
MTAPTHGTGTANARPEIGASVVAGGLATNYLESGQGAPVLLIHGSGPGVSAYANWRLTIPTLAERFHVVAPDMAGFGFSERPAHATYDLDLWVGQVVGLLDALGLDRVSVVGNSFGGAVALRLATSHPQLVDRLVLMGSVGVPFPITEGLDAVWGYEPSVPNMRRLLDIFAFNSELASDELAEVRFRASTQPGVQESFAAMFPAPRQRWVDAMVTTDDELATLSQPTLAVHGREDRVIALENSLRLMRLIPDMQLHVFGRRGHWTQIEHTVEFNRIVGDFLAG